MNIKPLLKIRAFTLVLALGWFAGFIGTVNASTEIVDGTVGEYWQTVLVKETRDGEESVRGYLLFTTNTEELGAAFRCEKGSLIALVSAEPVDFRQLLQLRFRGSEDWPVQFSVSGGEERTEDWVQMYRGKIYMVKETDTTKQIFAQAHESGALDFKRKYGKAVSLTMPAVEQNIFNQFLQDCALKAEYIPDFLSASKTASAPET